MISASMKGLARLAYEFSDLVSAVYNVLPSTFLLLQRKNREIIKVHFACVNFLQIEFFRINRCFLYVIWWLSILDIWFSLQANLGLLKVLVAKSQAEGLQKHLQSLVDGLLNWQDSTKNHFKAKVRIWLFRALLVIYDPWRFHAESLFINRNFPFLLHLTSAFKSCAKTFLLWVRSTLEHVTNLFLWCIAVD